MVEMQYVQNIKTIGANGQLSLGKAFAGKIVAIEQVDESAWIIKSSHFVPESEKWLHEKDNAKKLDRAFEWAKKNKPKDNFDKIAKDIENA